MQKRISQESVFVTSVGRQILPIILLMVLFSAFTLLLVFHAAERQNETARAANAHIAETAFRHMSENLTIYVTDYTYWDNATENVIANPDPEWVRDNITDWAVEGLGLNGAVIFGAGNRVLAGTGRWDVTENPEPLVPDSIRTLIAAARENGPTLGNADNAAWSPVMDSAGLHLAAASVFSWEESEDLPLENGQPVVLLYYKTLDAEYLQEIEERFLLDGLSLERPGTAFDNGQRNLHSLNGQILGVLTWQFDMPGDQMMREMSLPLALGLSVLAFLFWFLLGRAARAARLVTNYQHSLEKQADDLVTAKNEAMAANREKSRFLATMSHEIRTPLNAIIGFSDIMRQEEFKSLPIERFQNYAQDIHSSGHYLLNLINDVLDMSKIEAQRYELFEDVLSLDDLVTDSLKLIAGIAHNKSLVLEHPATGLAIFADSKALKQILVNLLTNAVKFTKTGGTVRVSAMLDGSDTFDILVIDNGIGMSAEDIEKAMKAFGQTRESRTSNMQGTGLGLNICRSLVELHGGEMILESEPGQGTTVRIRLPRSRLVDVTREERAKPRLVGTG